MLYGPAISQSDCSKAGPYQLAYNNYYLLTEFAFRTVRYYNQGPEVRTELARSVRKDRGLNILQYEKQTRLINSLSEGQEMRNGKPSLKSFRDLGLKLESCWVTHLIVDIDQTTSTGSFISSLGHLATNLKKITGTLTNTVTTFLISFLSCDIPYMISD